MEGSEPCDRVPEGKRKNACPLRCALRPSFAQENTIARRWDREEKIESATRLEALSARARMDRDLHELQDACDRVKR